MIFKLLSSYSIHSNHFWINFDYQVIQNIRIFYAHLKSSNHLCSFIMLVLVLDFQLTHKFKWWTLCTHCILYYFQCYRYCYIPVFIHTRLILALDSFVPTALGFWFFFFSFLFCLPNQLKVKVVAYQWSRVSNLWATSP